MSEINSDFFPKLNVNVQFLIETSDHDGYCSGNENDYNYTLKTIKLPLRKECFNSIDLSKELEFMISEINNFCNSKKSFYSKKLNKLYPKLNINGSFFCEPNHQSKQNQLSHHDFRITFYGFNLN